MNDNEIYVDCENCEYSRQTYYEYDTGCAEYDCDLLNCGCEQAYERCPLCCSYQIFE